MSLTSTVPASVPSLFHSSVPFALVVAVKNSVPSTFVRLPGLELPVVLMSFTSTGVEPPGAIFHSSAPPPLAPVPEM